MSVLFEMLKGLFMTLTILLIIFLTTGQRFLSVEQFAHINSVLMPAYLVLTGIVIGYVLNLIGTRPNETHEQQEKNSATAFIQGLVIGIFLALLYIFMG